MAAGSAAASCSRDGALSRSAVADGEYWRIVTAGFLHAGFFHLLFNMLSLWILGSCSSRRSGACASR